MAKVLLRWLPIITVLSIVVSMIGNYTNQNSAAVEANFVALIGWIYISIDSWKQN